MNFNFNFSKKDLINFNLHHYRTAPFGKYFRLFMKFNLPVISVYYAFKLPIFELIVIFSVISIIWLLTIDLVLDIFTKILCQLSLSRIKFPFGETYIKITEIDIYEKNNTTETRVEWKNVLKVHETKKFLLIYFSSVQSFLIPKAVISTLELEQIKEITLANDIKY
ncbi:MAG: YcxB-like protein, partial [Bacillales bacterium]|nr:YcxB-like protein [Bacillales bacterium]